MSERTCGECPLHGKDLCPRYAERNMDTAPTCERAAPILEELDRWRISLDECTARRLYLAARRETLESEFFAILKEAKGLK